MAPVGLALARGLALLAVGGMGKAEAKAPSGGGQNPLDPGMPPELDAKVRELLKSSTRPGDLESLAVIADARGYHNTAAALPARTAQLRAQETVPSVPLPAVGPRATPPPPRPTIYLPPIVPTPPAIPVTTDPATP